LNSFILNELRQRELETDREFFDYERERAEEYQADVLSDYEVNHGIVRE
jgi:hypothetical protein